MTTEQFITIVTTLLTNGGLATFLFFYIRSLKQQITGLNNTIEAQNKTLKIMEKQVLET
jgi:cell division protein FtsL